MKQYNKKQVKEILHTLNGTKIMTMMLILVYLLNKQYNFKEAKELLKIYINSYEK